MIIDQVSLLIYIQHQIRRFCNTPQNKTFLGRNLSSFRQHLHRFFRLQRRYPFIPSKTGRFIFFPQTNISNRGLRWCQKKKTFGINSRTKRILSHPVLGMYLLEDCTSLSFIYFPIEYHFDSFAHRSSEYLRIYKF